MPERNERFFWLYAEQVDSRKHPAAAGAADEQRRKAPNGIAIGGVHSAEPVAAIPERSVVKLATTSASLVQAESTGAA